MKQNFNAEMQRPRRRKDFRYLFSYPAHVFASVRLCVAFVLALLPACGQHALAQAAEPIQFSKEAMLQNIASNVLGAGWQAAALNSRRLTNCLGELAATPNQQKLERARASWLETADAFCRLRCFQAGPLAERDCAGTFYYWQVLGPRIEALVNSTNAVDQAVVDQLGSTTKGLFALEYLLFDAVKGPGTLELLSGTNSARRAAVLLALGHDLEQKASLVAGDWAAPEKNGAMSKFVVNGQQSVNVLVNQLAAVVEYEAERHLKFVLMLRLPISPQLNRIERARSSSSLEGVVASLEGARRLYRGGEGLGIDDAVQRLNEPLAKKLDEQFEAAIAGAQAIGAPLEKAAEENRAAIETAYEKVRALEILIKVDLASALGVTLTFGSNDGD